MPNCKSIKNLFQQIAFLCVPKFNGSVASYELTNDAYSGCLSSSTILH